MQIPDRLKTPVYSPDTEYLRALEEELVRYSVELSKLLNKGLTLADNFLKGGLQYGCLFLYNNSTGDTVASGSYVQMTRFDTNGPYSGQVTPDHTNDHITIGEDGDYLIAFSTSFSGTGSVTWDGGVFTNNGGTKIEQVQMSRKLGASGDVGSASAIGIASLSAGDTIEVWLRQQEGVNKDITVVNCGLVVLKLGSG